MTRVPPHLRIVEQRLLWLSHWMIHYANHIRPWDEAAPRHWCIWLMV